MKQSAQHKNMAEMDMNVEMDIDACIRNQHVHEYSYGNTIFYLFKWHEVWKQIHMDERWLAM